MYVYGRKGVVPLELEGEESINTTKEGRLLYMEGQGESLKGRLLTGKKKRQVRKGSGASRLLYD